MIERKNIPIKEIAWVAPSDAGVIGTLYEPENVAELTTLCQHFFEQNTAFDLVGHTSNILYTSRYSVERMVSTRRVDHYRLEEDHIICECGTNVRLLAQSMTKAGVKGFDGLIDLPGTVGSALYGNAGCFQCSVSALLMEATLLLPDGTVQTATPEWFHFTQRSSALKRQEQKAIILSATLRKETGDASILMHTAEENHRKRRAAQPGPKNSLGSIFSNSGEPTELKHQIDGRLSELEVRLISENADLKTQREETTHQALALLGEDCLQPYVRAWNWYQWNDDNAHRLFWNYVKQHRRMFTRSDFEIEIKGLDSAAIEQLIAEQ